jgi:hypothetical protein
MCWPLAQAGIHWWILAPGSPALLAHMGKNIGRYVINAPMRFAPPNGVAYLESLGWSCAEVRAVLHAARRFRRLPFFLGMLALFPEPDPRKSKSRW